MIRTTLQQNEPAQRPQVLVQFIRQQLAELLELDSVDEIADTQAFIDLGTDSMQAVDFKSRLESELACSLRTTLVFDYPRLDLLADYLLNDVLQLEATAPGLHVAPTDEVHPKLPLHFLSAPDEQQTDVAIVGMAGVFPTAATATALWDRVLEGTYAVFTLPQNPTALSFGTLATSPKTAVPSDRARHLTDHLLTDSLAAGGLSAQSLTERKTGVFMAASPEPADGRATAYQIPLPNQLSFDWNLQGPSESVQTFCSSVYVALHRAIQSLHAGECEQAVVGAVNLISAQTFADACQNGLYADLLSPDNQTRSFSPQASGFVRSEGAGVLIIKPLAQARKDGNRILAVIKSSAVHHGGRGFSPEAPHVQGMKETIRRCFQKAHICPDTIDYIEAHGIGNVLADTLEVSALHDAYRELSTQPGKHWYLSSVKPTVGHPEVAAGMASLLKAIQALVHQTIPGLPGADQPNPELEPYPALRFSPTAQPWHTSSPRRRVALNTYAIGGVNAHLILEEYRIPDATETVSSPPQPFEEQPLPAAIPIPDPVPVLDAVSEHILADAVWEVCQRNWSDLDQTHSPIHDGLDSIRLVQLMRRLNERLGMQLRAGQVLSVASWQELYTLVATGVGQAVPVQAAVAVTADLHPSYPVSEVQKGLWYLHKTNPDSTSFSVPMVCRVSQPVQEEALQTAYDWLLRTYPVLRVNLVQDLDAEDVRQYVRPLEAMPPLTRQVLPPGRDVSQWVWSLLRQPFQLETEPLIRLYVLSQEASQSHYVVFIVHHSILDGLSGVGLLQNFWDTYRQLCEDGTQPDAAPDLAFFTFPEWEKTYLESPQAADDLKEWQTRLMGISPCLPLPYDHPPQALQADKSVGCEAIVLTAAEWEAVQRTARALDVQVSVLLLSVFNVFLHKLTCEEDIVVTSPVQGRPLPIHENSIGCYINLMVTRSRVDHRQTFGQLVAHTRQQFVQGMDHAYYPYSRLLSALGLAQGTDEIPLPVSYSYQNIFDGLSDQTLRRVGVEVEYTVWQETADYYTLEVYDFRHSLQLNLKYRQSLFEAATMQRHRTYFQTLLHQVLANPQRAVQDYTLLPAAEAHQLLVAFNQTQAPYPRQQCIHELFENQARIRPEQTALVFQGRSMTYRELEEKSRQLAIYLQQQGIQPDTLIGVCLERSAEMIVAVLGILRVGGAYVPIDPTYAPERIGYMLRDSGVGWLLTHTALDALLTPLCTETHCQTVYLNQPLPVAEPFLLRSLATPQNLAYVIYTSGSTGKPKGVQIIHQSVVNLSQALIDLYGITPTDRVLQFASLSFDMSVEEIFPYLMAGAGIVIRQQNDTQADRFYELVTGSGVTILNLPPLFYTVIDQLSAVEKATLFAQVRLLSMGGEALPEAILSAARQQDIRLFNAYGPTEYTVNAALAELTHCTEVVIGKPLSNTQLYVLGPGLTPQPLGVAGELHIAGDGLARGYLNQERLTAQTFIANPFGEGRLYKTGDRVRWRPDGTLEYVGRLDEQVKIRGFRVEPGEVETVLAAHPALTGAAVIAQKNTQTSRLIAYYTAETLLSEADLRAWLLQKLPDYMVPAAFVRLEQFPFTASGKIDRKALQIRPVDTVQRASYVAPRSVLEIKLVQVWEELLGVDKIGVQDNFFELGGHSLLSIQLVNRIAAHYHHTPVQVVDILRHPTIAQLAAVIQENLQEGEALHADPYIIRLRKGKGDPTFVIPGMPGLADGYFQMAARIPGNGPVYGLQMRGFMDEAPLERIEDMARHNLDLIASMQPQGPIHLYTHSYGGVVVYEMLRQLADYSFTVGRVVLVECVTSVALADIARESVLLFCDSAVNYLGIHPEAFYERVEVLLQQPKETWKDGLLTILCESEMRFNKSVLISLLALLDKSVSVDYRLSEKLPYAVDVVLSHTWMALLAEAASTADPKKGWDTYFTSVRLLSAGGDHVTIVKEPYLSEWIQKL